MTNFYFTKKINNILLVVHKDLSFDKRLQGDFNLVNENFKKIIKNLYIRMSNY